MMAYVHSPSTQKAEIGGSYARGQLGLRIETWSEEILKCASQEKCYLDLAALISLGPFCPGILVISLAPGD